VHHFHRLNVQIPAPCDWRRTETCCRVESKDSKSVTQLTIKRIETVRLLAYADSDSRAIYRAFPSGDERRLPACGGQRSDSVAAMARVLGITDRSLAGAIPAIGMGEQFRVRENTNQSAFVPLIGFSGPMAGRGSFIKRFKHTCKFNLMCSRVVETSLSRSPSNWRH
jgi:hypothetical protein